MPLSTFATAIELPKCAITSALVMPTVLENSHPMSSADDVSNLTEDERTMLAMNVGQRIAHRIEVLKSRGWDDKLLTPTALGRPARSIAPSSISSTRAT